MTAPPNPRVWHIGANPVNGSGFQSVKVDGIEALAGSFLKR